MDELYYANAKALILGFIKRDLDKLIRLKKEMIVAGNKAAIAQVSSVLSIVYLDYEQDSLNALAELLYALPEIQPNMNKAVYGFFYDKELVLFHIYWILYDLGAYESSYQYGKAYFALSKETSPELISSADYFLMVMLASQLGLFEEAFAYSDEFLTKAEQGQPSDQLYAILAKVVVLARRNAPGDIEQALKLLSLSKPDIQREDWNAIDEARALAVNAMEAGLQRNVSKAYQLISDLKLLANDPAEPFHSVDTKNLTELERFIAEYNLDSELAAITSLKLVQHEHGKLLNALNNRLDSLGREMQADIELVNVEKMKAQNITQRQAIETANLKTIILLLVITLVATLAAWLFVQRRRTHHLAYTDPLTSAPNRRFMFNLLAKAFAKPRTGNCIALIDIDHFKRVNDTYGHQTGDEVLVACSRVIRSRLRSTDQYCRYGGEEFLLLLKEISVPKAKDIMDDIRLSLSGINKWQSTSANFSVSFSCGLVELSQYNDIDDAIAHCDKLLYTAKNKGRGRTITTSLENDIVVNPLQTV
ncbi:hypothetical protein GCM10011338_07680 [Alteromonas lipolytica]|nr:hypothetical protein GCM10011338_07680 [Alteromonas lipolytica]